MLAFVLLECAGARATSLFLACFISILALGPTAQADLDHDWDAQLSSLLQVSLNVQKEQISPPGDHSVLRASNQVDFKHHLNEISKGPSSFPQTYSRFNCSSDSLLIFTRPKTGSTSLASSFNDLCGWNVHYYATKRETYPPGIKVDANADIAQDFLSKVPDKSKVWIFTMIRDPFKRGPSLYYQLPHPGYFQAKHGVHDVDKHILGFHKWFPKSIDREKYFFNVFANVTGVDIDRVAFNPDEHHLFTSTALGNKLLNIVLLRLEDSDTWEQALAEYIPGFVVKEANVKDEGAAALAYEEFKDHFIYSDSERSEMLKSDALPFYSQTEVGNMLSGQMVAFPR